ncbi:MAG TPA: hypothetical protein DD381_10565 [Lentisphaeria bacterium]|nr:MAG: hypothetical protein A2X47_02105 [Lentisphaerae bacterium GWF2_38_69]HBM16769.1 hypothetical protein [Lentisphaeria bacterium]
MKFYHEKFKELQKNKGKSLTELANSLEISPQYMSNIATGRKVPSKSQAVHLAIVLEVPVSSFTDLPKYIRKEDSKYYSLSKLELIEYIHSLKDVHIPQNADVIKEINFSLFFNRLINTVILINDKYKIEHYSDKILKLLNSKEKINGLKVSNAFPLKLANALIPQIKAVFETGLPDVQIKNINGENKKVYTSLMIQGVNKYCLLEIVNFTTDSKMLRDEIKVIQSQSQLQKYIDNMDDCCTWYGGKAEDGKIHYYHLSSNFESMFGIPNDELMKDYNKWNKGMNKKDLELIHKQLGNQNNCSVYAYRFKVKGKGIRRFMAWNYNSMIDGKLVTHGITRDITDCIIVKNPYLFDSAE